MGRGHRDVLGLYGLERNAHIAYLWRVGVPLGVEGFIEEAVTRHLEFVPPLLQLLLRLLRQGREHFRGRRHIPGIGDVLELVRRQFESAELDFVGLVVGVREGFAALVFRRRLSGDVILLGPPLRIDGILGPGLGVGVTGYGLFLPTYFFGFLLLFLLHVLVDLDRARKFQGLERYSQVRVLESLRGTGLSAHADQFPLIGLIDLVGTYRKAALLPSLKGLGGVKVITFVPEQQPEGCQKQNNPHDHAANGLTQAAAPALVAHFRHGEISFCWWNLSKHPAIGLVG